MRFQRFKSYLNFLYYNFSKIYRRKNGIKREKIGKFVWKKVLKKNILVNKGEMSSLEKGDARGSYMSSFKLFGTELKLLKNKKGALIALIGVMLIPIVYCAVLLSATWGPYDNLDNLPVAVVNKDTGAVSDGNPINVGNDLVETLKASNTLGWDFVSEEDAKAGLESNKYYMVVEIPEDFSQKVTTVLTANPQEPELKYIQNEGLNFMGAQVTNSAVERLREQLGDKITATYATTLLSKFGDVGTGFGAAADGSSQIYDGTVSLSEGTNTLLTSLQEKAPDIAKLAAGAQAANQGAGQLLSSVQGGTGDINALATGAGALAQGAKDLNAGAQQVAGGLKTAQAGSQQLEQGLTGQLIPGAKQLAAGVEQLGTGAVGYATGANDFSAGATRFVAGAEQVVGGLTAVVNGVGQAAPGAQQVAGGIGEAITGVTQLEGGAKQVAGGVGEAITGVTTLEGYAQQVAQGIATLAQNPALASNPQVQALVEGSKQVAGGLTQLKTKAGELQTGANQVAGGLTELKTKAGALQTGATQLSGGLQQINAGVQSQLASGVNQLSQGLTGLQTGAQQLQAGAQQLDAGSKQVVPGAQQIAAGLEQQLLPGVQSLNGGLTQLSTGADALAVGSTTLTNGAGQLSAGTQKLKTSWGTLTKGASDLKAGLTQIADGTATVNTGWNTLSEGATELNAGANKLKDGSKTLSESLAGGAEQVNSLSVNERNIAMFASPVKTTGEKVNGYTYYRDSTAPYILSLALFVGMLVLSFFVDFKKPAILPGSAISWFLSKWLQLALFAVIQAVLVSLFVLFVLGLDVANAGLLILFAIFVSLTFMSIVFFLVSVGGNIGRFLALVFIVLQLSITGSNLPIPMLPENLQSLSQFLPLTYSNAGFKAVISLGDNSLLSSNASVLAIWLVVTSVFALIAFALSYRTLRTSTIPTTSDVI